MNDTNVRLDRVRRIDGRIRQVDGTWSGEYFYEWPCGCRVYIPVFRDGSLGADHRDEYCRHHSDEPAMQQTGSLKVCLG